MSASAVGDIVFISWVGEDAQGKYHSFMSISRDHGRTYSQPVELTNPSSSSTTVAEAEPSHSDMCSDGNTITSAWQELNTQTGKKEVWGSISYDNGKTFTTARISDLNPHGDAHSYVMPAENCQVVGYLFYDENTKANVVLTHFW